MRVEPQAAHARSEVRKPHARRELFKLRYEVLVIPLDIDTLLMISKGSVFIVVARYRKVPDQASVLRKESFSVVRGVEGGDFSRWHNDRYRV